VRTGADCFVFADWAITLFLLNNKAPEKKTQAVIFMICIFIF